MTMNEKQIDIIFRTRCKNRDPRSKEAAKIAILEGISGYAAEKKAKCQPNQVYSLIKLIERENAYFQELNEAENEQI